MPSDYPTSLDDFDNPNPNSLRTDPSHAEQHSDANDAIEAVETKLGVGASPAASAVSGAVLTRQGDGTTAWDEVPSVATHESDTTDVHGITDTSALETTTGAQAKADAAQAAAEATAAADTDADVTTHEAAADPHGDRAYADAAVGTHETNGHGPVPVDDVAGTTYALVLTDQERVKRFIDEALVSVTVPTDAVVAFPVGAEVALLAYGAAGITVVGDTGVTVRNAGSLAQYELAVLLKVATDEWVLTGNVT